MKIDTDQVSADAHFMALMATRGTNRIIVHMWLIVILCVVCAAALIVR